MVSRGLVVAYYQYSYQYQRAEYKAISARLGMAASGKSFIDATASHADHIKIWLMWGTNFSEPVRSQYLDFEEEMLDRLARHLIGDAAGTPDAALKERTLIFLGAVGVLAQMAIRGEPKVRLERYAAT